ncbi:flagellar export chaperone FlgN [Marinilactibacillus kalidii]|uniref:flagellar export chaperone FlgN n=1 Tax=Marinilactibacillus kalidii TaxID=2820274 RepID=UPI001ABDD418|nr:flagellar export chaperone FlgN [Marinilactibacillus kalidii]
MSKTTIVLTKMSDLKTLLLEERAVLIHNDGERLLELVSEKEALMLELASFDENEINIDELVEAAKEIKELQETNIMLTEQSLSFTEQLISNIQKNVTKKNTYSKKGTFEKSGQTAFLDQSL